MMKIKLNKIGSVFSGLILLAMMTLNATITTDAAYDNTHNNSGDQCEDIVAIAKTQIGYHEGSVDGTINGSNNYTKYNVDFGKIGGSYNYAWCQSFVTWCAKQANIPSNIIPRVSGTISAKDKFKEWGVYRKGPFEGGNFIPSAGDIIYFYSPDTSSEHHVGIVSGCDGNYVYTIEGNSGNAVSQNKYSVSYSRIRGYGVPKYKRTEINPEASGHVMSESEAAGRTIPDGDYWICSGFNMNYYLDIPGVEIASSGTNVWMWNYGEEMPTEYDVWTVTYLDNGFYRIKQKGSNVSLDVDGGTVEKGANVQLWLDNDSNAQQWSIARTDHGYTLQARCSAYFMDIYDAGTENGTNVSTFTKNGARWQNWCFIPYNINESPIVDGIYNIQTACDPNYYVDAEGTHDEITHETNVLIYNEKTDPFKVTYIGDGWYTICEASSGLSLDVYNYEPGNYLDVGLNIQLHENHQGRNQLWKIRDAGDGHYWIISKMNGYYMDLEFAKAECGTNISQYSYNGGTNQKWNFIPVTLTEIIVTPPYKTNYTVGETLDIDGLKVIAKFSDTSIKDVTSEIRVSSDLSTAGTKTITLSYTEGSITKTAKFKVNVAPAELIEGDCNGDGRLDVSDVILLQKWLHSEVKTMKNWKAANLCKDDKIDAFDLCFMKRELITQ